MKKLLIAVCLSGLLSVPSVVLGAEMAGPSLYGSFRTGLTLSGSSDARVGDFVSRWGIKGSHEVSEGLTASYKYEAKMNTTNAQSSGEAGRLSYISLSGGFGTVSLGQIWSASAIHYGFAVDPSYVNGVFGGVDYVGGANYRNANSVSYSSSAGDVSFQIDKVTGVGVTGVGEKVELGASASFGPVGVGLGYWGNDNDDASFTGVAVSTGAAGVNLTVGLGSSKLDDGAKTKTNILHVGGSLGDSGFSYALQVANSNADAGDGDQNLLVVTNSLGSGASLIFEHTSYGDDTESKSLIGLKVDF